MHTIPSSTFWFAVYFFGFINLLIAATFSKGSCVPLFLCLLHCFNRCLINLLFTPPWKKKPVWLLPPILLLTAFASFKISGNVTNVEGIAWWGALYVALIGEGVGAHYEYRVQSWLSQGKEQLGSKTFGVLASSNYFGELLFFWSLAIISFPSLPSVAVAVTYTVVNKYHLRWTQPRLFYPVDEEKSVFLSEISSSLGFSEIYGSD